MAKNGKHVLVTTEYRGVFFGELASETDNGRTVVLNNVRCAIRFGTKGGFMELAQDGPTSNSKIGTEAPSVKLYGVTSIVACTEKAVKTWKSA